MDCQDLLRSDKLHSRFTDFACYAPRCRNTKKGTYGQLMRLPVASCILISLTLQSLRHDVATERKEFIVGLKSISACMNGSALEMPNNLAYAVLAVPLMFPLTPIG